jgi:folate-binding protein YgfZ
VIVNILFQDRSERGKLRFTGPQSAWFLHQILTQSFEDMRPGEARDAAKLTAHGRMTGYMEFVATEEAFLCHFEPELRATLPEEIARYVFATQVTIEDVTERSALVLVAGEGWERLASVAAPGEVTQPTRSLGVAAGYIWSPRDRSAAVLTSLRDAGGREASETEVEALRVEHGMPRWGREMDQKTFPQEAGIDAWAVHYDKGCYVGQEAMAKIHFRGKVNRRVARLEGLGMEPGREVLLAGTKVGTVTSVTDRSALAMVRYTIEPGDDVSVGDAPAKVVA